MEYEEAGQSDKSNWGLREWEVRSQMMMIKNEVWDLVKQKARKKMQGVRGGRYEWRLEEARSEWEEMSKWVSSKGLRSEDVRKGKTIIPDSQLGPPEALLNISRRGMRRLAYSVQDWGGGEQWWKDGGPGGSATVNCGEMVVVGRGDSKA